MKDYQQLVNHLAEETRIRVKRDVADKSFTERKLGEKVAEKTKSISTQIADTFERSIAELISEIISYNVNDKGIVIKGKRDNVALSKYGIKVLMNRSNSLRKAGRLSAYQFADDYRKVSKIDGIPEVAPDICDFMTEYSKFDKMSAWYKNEVEFVPSGFGSEAYISAEIEGAFTAYPNLELHEAENSDNEYLEGYLQSLFNACSDHLRLVYWTQRKNSSHLFALDTKESKEPHPTKMFMQLHYTQKYIEAWRDIDCIIYYLINQLNSDALERTDIFEITMAFRDLQTLMAEQFKGREGSDLKDITISSIYNLPYEQAIKQVEEAAGYYEKNKYILHSLLNEIRVCYEDLRISVLKDGAR